MSTLSVKQFFESDYINYGSYDNYRKIANYIDGLKPTSRKVLYTVLKFKIDSPLKTSQLASRTAEHTCYLHGEAGISNVIVGMAQDFAGSNNIPLLQRDGNFGTRFVPEAAASRYIKTCKEKYLDKVFRPEDSLILDEQIFEGEKIEPKYFMPIIPMLIVNGSEGISSGFAQKILSRNPEDVKKCILSLLTKKKLHYSLTPWFNGFEGVVQKDPENPESDGWEILGVCEKISSTSIMVTEVPIGYSLSQYLKVLDDLEEKGVIVNYKDMSTDDKFKFEVKVQRKAIEDKNNYQILQTLKLVKKVTENFTCCNENLAVTEFKCLSEIIKAYYTMRLKYLQKRKDYQLQKLRADIILNKSKYLFVKGVVEDEIQINNKSYEFIEKQLKKIPDIKLENESYDYLLTIPVRSLTKEKYEELREHVKDLGVKYKELEKKSIEDIWIDELNELKF